MDEKHEADVRDHEEDPSTTRDAPPPSHLNPDLVTQELRRGARPGDVYVRRGEPYRHIFRRIGPGHFVAMPGSDRPSTAFERFYRLVKRVLIGAPLQTAEEIHQRLTKIKALAVFGSDAISSCAYATEASLFILMAAGNTALPIALYISVAIALLLSMVAFSYRQTVYAYPHGGGSYTVSRENLGELPGLVAASALLTDYVLTVAVSIAAGSAALISALIASGFGAQVDSIEASLPAFLNLNVIISLAFITVMTVANLRGIRESGSIFAVVTYLFLVSLGTLLVVGLFQSFNGTLRPATPPPVLVATEPITLWLILRAFSAGSVAMSGTEAISNGVPVFQPPETKNAATTLTAMATLLALFFLGVSYLATRLGLVPGEQTIVSQIALSVFGTTIPYYVFQIATTGILAIAANTAFAGFPALASVLARDGYMPRQFTYRGDRLAFSTGIVALGIIAASLVVLFAGSVDSLIHLYAIGVFLAFCLSSSGMVVHWLKSRGKGWHFRIVVNGLTAILTGIILVIVAVTKFVLGAWIVIILIPGIVSFFLFVHRHYERVAKQLHIQASQLPPPRIDQLVLVPIDDINYASLRALAFARTISKSFVVLHISTDAKRAERIEQRVKEYAPDATFIVVDSPLRAFTRPLLTYINAVHSQSPSAFVTIVLPEFITAHWWEGFLHNRTANRLRRAFERHPNVAVVLVPYLLEG